MEKFRKVEVLRAGIWYNSDFTDITNGDMFRMFESDGTPVIGEDGSYIFKAESEVYNHPDSGVLTVNTVEIVANSDEDLDIYETC